MSAEKLLSTTLAVVDVAARLVELLLDLVPHEKARALLDDAAIRRARAVADLIEVERGLR